MKSFSLALLAIDRKVTRTNRCVFTWPLMLLFFIPITLLGQEVEWDRKSKAVRVDGVYSFKIDKRGCGMTHFEATDCHFAVYDKQGMKIIKITYKRFYSPEEVTESNTHGSVRYYEVWFLESGKKAEIKTMRSTKNVAEHLVAEGLIRKGLLDVKTMNSYVEKYGRTFSPRNKYEGRFDYDGWIDD